MTPFPADLVPPHFDAVDTLRPERIDDQLRYRDIRFAIETGWRPLYLDLAVPRISSPDPKPVVVYIHGGAWMFGDNRPAPAGDIDFDEIIDRLLEAGIAVARVQYRLSSEAPFPACLHDVKAAVRYLRAHATELALDKDRVFSFGDSAGGHLASFLAVNVDSEQLEGTRGVSTGSSQVNAAVAWYPVTSITHLNEQSLPDAMIDRTRGDGPESLLIGADVNLNPDAAKRASPATYVDPSASPLLLIHGDTDRIVPHGQSVVMCDAYEAARVQVEFITVPGADHCFFDADAAPLIDRTIEFLVEQAFDR